MGGRITGAIQQFIASALANSQIFLEY